MTFWKLCGESALDIRHIGRHMILLIWSVDSPLQAWREETPFYVAQSIKLQGAASLVLWESLIWIYTVGQTRERYNRSDLGHLFYSILCNEQIFVQIFFFLKKKRRVRPSLCWADTVKEDKAVRGLAGQVVMEWTNGEKL